MTEALRNRNITIDIAKGICIVLVVIGHYLPDNSPHWYIVLNKFIYSFHMPLFLFASGYIYSLTKRDESYKSFIWRKCKRLIVPYLITSILLISFKLLGQGKLSTENPVTASAYLEMLWYPSAGYFLWFIWTLMTVFLIVPVLKTTKLRLFALVVTLFLNIFTSYISLPSVFCINITALMGVYFFAGVVAYDFKTKLGRLLNYNFFIISTIFVFLEIGYETLYSQQTILAHLYILIVAFFGTFFVIKTSSELKKYSFLRQVFLKISSCSFLIYLFHTLFEGVTKGILAKAIPTLSSTYFFPVALIVISCGVTFPMIMQHFAQKDKILSNIFGLKYKTH